MNDQAGAEVATEASANAEAVRARWSENHDEAFSREVFWLAVREVRDRYRFKATGGEASGTWTSYLVNRFLGPEAHALHAVSLGCGPGSLERELHQLRSFSRCDAFDITPATIETARSEAARSGISNIDYAVRDLQSEGLPRKGYDVAWCTAILHHIERLEFVLDEVHASLAPGGWLFVNDYVGANRFDMPERQRECLSSLFRLIPQRLRRSCFEGSGRHVMSAPAIPDPEAVVRADPSEAVRSEDIVAAIGERFDIVARHDCGGSLLHWILGGIAGNFTSGDPASMRCLQMLFDAEDVLLESGELTSDFAVIAARPKASYRRPG